MSSPTSRSLAKLRADGWLAYVVERWIVQARKRIDFAGFADILAYGKGAGVLAVQTTTGSYSANRMSKILNSSEAERWLADGNLIEVHGWAKRGERGKRKLWTASVRTVILLDFNPFYHK